MALTFDACLTYVYLIEHILVPTPKIYQHGGVHWTAKARGNDARADSPELLRLQNLSFDRDL